MPTSLATQQRSLGDPSISYPLFPPLTSGCPRTSTEEVQYPLEVDYDYQPVDGALFDQAPLPGIDRWAPLLPPLSPAIALQEGGTPLVDISSLAAPRGSALKLWLKDESRNPTWSHKDRLNRCTVSAAFQIDAPGVVVASSGNHGASAAAYAAHAGLRCIVLVSPDAPPAILSFLRAYDAAVLALPSSARWTVLRMIVERAGYHPLSNTTSVHTGHPFGPEGYKTIAYETYLQLGRRSPVAVFLPTGYGELLFGVWKGFRELHDLGVSDRIPRIISCEPAPLAPLHHALKMGRHAVTVPGAPTDAYAIACTVNSYRSVVAVTESGGTALTLSDAEMFAAQKVLAQNGLWQELSGAAGVAGALQMLEKDARFEGPVVCIGTSSGFKDRRLGQQTVPEIVPEWADVKQTLFTHYDVKL